MRYHVTDLLSKTDHHSPADNFWNIHFYWLQDVYLTILYTNNFKKYFLNKLLTWLSWSRTIVEIFCSRIILQKSSIVLSNGYCVAINPSFFLYPYAETQVIILIFKIIFNLKYVLTVSTYENKDKNKHLNPNISIRYFFRNTETDTVVKVFLLDRCSGSIKYSNR